MKPIDLEKINLNDSNLVNNNNFEFKDKIHEIEKYITIFKGINFKLAFLNVFFLKKNLQ